jgi:transcriptional regulator with XRE-family HTH domain
MTPNDKNETFPERLRQLLTDRGETAASLARMVDVTPQAVGKWLKGGDIAFDTLERTANWLGVNWVWLRYGPAAMRAAQEGTHETSQIGLLRREYVAQMMESELRFQKICEAFGIGVFEENPMTGQAYWSPIARTLIGAPQEMEASHDNWYSLIASEDKPAVVKAYSELVLGKENRAILKYHAVVNITDLLVMKMVIDRDATGNAIKICGTIQIAC